jgi:hypothetical protein
MGGSSRFTQQIASNLACALILARHIHSFADTLELRQVLNGIFSVKEKIAREARFQSLFGQEERGLQNVGIRRRVYGLWVV